MGRWSSRSQLWFLSLALPAFVTTVAGGLLE